MAPGARQDHTDLKIRVHKALLNRISDYRHEHKFDSRKDAIIDLLNKGLDAAKPLPTAENGKTDAETETKEGQDA